MRDFKIGATSLALLAFLRTGRRDDPVDRAATFLANQQDSRGCIGLGTSTPMKNHLLASLALTEIVCRKLPLFLETEAHKAIWYAINGRTPGRGWGFAYRSPACKFSTTGWGFELIRTADAGGLRGMEFMILHVAAFMNEAPAQDAAMSKAVRLLGRRVFEYENAADSQRLVRELLECPELNFGEAYFVSRALRERDGEAWRAWNLKLKTLILAKQNTIEGDCRFGSWASGPDEDGRVAATSLAILTLLETQKVR